MPRFVSTRPPSFPNVSPDAALVPVPQERWQVLCGDAGHWRAGAYSPPQYRADQVHELERHDCPELFLLVAGNVTLVLSDDAGGTRELALEPGKPVLVSTPLSDNARSITGRAEAPISEPTTGL